MRFSVLILLLLLDQMAFAGWQRVVVEGARCGDGSEYPIFVDRDPASRELTLILMGGGACWDRESCFGVIPSTSLKAPSRVPPLGGILRKTTGSRVFLPYCTGDVFAGQHEAIYRGRRVLHLGRENLEKALDSLVSTGVVDAFLEKIVVYGYSAGALGALLGLPYIANVFAPIPDKVIVADSPGLHFGTTFWEKFSPSLRSDYETGVRDLGLDFDANSGNLGGQMHKVCQNFALWNLAFLQGTKDIVMSSIFGNISGVDQERLIYGSTGIIQSIRDRTENCSVWVPKTLMHTFLISDLTASWSYNLGISAIDFFAETVAGVIRYDY